MSETRKAIARAEIETVIARYASAEGSNATPVPGLRVSRLTAPMAPRMFFYEPSLCVCIRGRKRMLVGDTEWTQGPDDFLLYAAGMPSIVTIDQASPSAPYIALLLAFDLELARDMLAEIELSGIPREPSSAGVMLDRIGADLLDAIARLVALIERPADIAIMAKLLQREIVYRLLTGPRGGQLRKIIAAGSPGHRIARALDWLRDHYAEPLSIDRLAGLAGMGVSTFHRHFQRTTLVSPLQYQKQLRLVAARRLMLTDQVDAGSAAFQVGYESPTQFSREYHRLFGRPPARDVAAIRRESKDQEAI